MSWGAFFFYISLRGERDCSAERRGLLWQGAPASRARVEIDCAERPAGLFSCVFVPVRSGGMARGLRDSAGLALAVSVRQRRQGGYRRITVASAIRAIEAEAEQHNHVVSVMPGVDVCAGISNGLWPRGASLPMVHCQRRITRGSPRRAGLRRCRFYGRIPPTQAMPVFQAGRPPATGSFGCAPDYPVELDWRGSLADCWFQ